ncbi:hypothetical protein COY05_04160 [Candidatus Peregrinibacteria bacterium CG_4_10_14_0_2_um_filter_38_24]|nr:MAG: hypothetical protein COY05_04160 [Candidatus Peregrinibacteria bacterium CG_4_10_14_0_2_um_filter_38_24]PJC38549.1 MAG: hypothetical protein CO044_04385 [Candidatus Peregrinibacteria bacterium CG_4_9_14_0_2_um_filter_38_9]
MKIIITTNKNRSTTILSKISMFFFGAFVTAILWALLSKYLGEYGIITGLLSMITLIFLGFKKTQKNTYPRIIVYGMLSTTILASILILGFLLIVKTA